MSWKHATCCRSRSRSTGSGVARPPRGSSLWGTEPPRATTRPRRRQPFAERNDHDLLLTLVDLNRALHRDFTYEPGITQLETTPYEVFRDRRGVCQDFANLFICLARLQSVPARYRVGYIHTGSDYAEKRQSEASHAWAEVYLPWYGWRGFDPTNGTLSGLDHVRVAAGRKYRDATPTSGIIYRGGGGETLSVDVKVAVVEED